MTVRCTNCAGAKRGRRPSAPWRGCYTCPSCRRAQSPSWGVQLYLGPAAPEYAVGDLDDDESCESELFRADGSAATLFGVGGQAAAMRERFMDCVRTNRGPVSYRWAAALLVRLDEHAATVPGLPDGVLHALSLVGITPKPVEPGSSWAAGDWCPSW